MDQNRLKSPVLWAAVVAQIVSMLVLLGVIDTGFGDVVNKVAASLCELLVLFGVLNNPTAQDKF